MLQAANSGTAALEAAALRPPDLILLDWMLPGLSGIELCRRLRGRPETRNVPIIMLTARGEETDRIRGLSTGADDYVAKPFHMEEVLAHLRALVRRSAGLASNVVSCGPVEIDTRSGRVAVDGQTIKLTSHEYRLSAYLMLHKDRVVSRTELIEHLYDQDFDRDSNTIEVFVGRLRKKIPAPIIETMMTMLSESMMTWLTPTIRLGRAVGKRIRHSI